MVDDEEKPETPAPPADEEPASVLPVDEETHALKSDGGAEEGPRGGCRQCCSFPHGKNALIASIIGTIAAIFSILAVNNCHFLKSNYLYCHPPPPKAAPFGTCGDCHCINGDDPCPSDPDEIPLMDMSDDWLKQLKSMTPLNPYTMVCNPYQTNNQVSRGNFVSFVCFRTT